MIHTIIYTGLAPDLEDVKVNVWDNYGSQVVVDGVLTYIDNNVYYFNFDIQDL